MLQQAGMNTPEFLKKRLAAVPQSTRAIRICVAESLTSGLLQSRIASVSGASDYFVGGITAYNIDQKVGLLGVDRAHATEVNCVSERVAIEMANGAIKMFGADIAVATTGYAEPNDQVEIPFACFAIVALEPQRLDARLRLWPSNIGDKSGRITSSMVMSRIDTQRYMAEAVLNQLRLFLESV